MKILASNLRTVGDDPEGGIMALDEQVLNEISGGVPRILIGPILPAFGLGAVVDGVTTGINDAIGAFLMITKIL
jgi:hypothetical protein